MNTVLEACEPSARYFAALEPTLIQQFDLIASAPNGVARLRELILSLAVQGKLVAQDPNDESASVLLERIRAEKARLVKEGKIKKEKVLAAIGKGEKPFGLPKGWEWSCLAGIGVINPRNDSADESEASFVQMSSIPVAFMKAHATEIRLWGDIKSGFTHFAEGDVGVAKITPCFENGKSTVFRNLRNGIGAGTTELHIVRPLGQVSPDYVLIFLKTPSFLKEGECGMTGSAGQKRLPRSYFETKPFPLPPLAEQTRIITRIEELMALCDSLEAKGKLEAEQHARLVGSLFESLANSESAHALAENWQRIATHFDLLLNRPSAVEALEQTILQLAVRGRLVPQNPADEPASVLLQKIRSEKDRLIAAGQLKRDKPLPPISDEETPFELPEGWEWVRCGEYFQELCTGPFGSVIHKEDYVSDGIPLINPSHMIDGEIIADFDVSVPPEMALRLTAYRLSAGDIVLARRGEMGRFALVTENEDGWLCGTGSFFAKLHVECNRRYLALQLLDPRFRQHLLGQSVGSTMVNMNQRTLLETLVAIPPLAEQSRIVARVAELRALCAQLRERLATTAQTQSRLAETLIEKAVA